MTNFLSNAQVRTLRAESQFANQIVTAKVDFCPFRGPVAPFCASTSVSRIQSARKRPIDLAVYSIRSARIGSMLAARLAGMSAAQAETRLIATIAIAKLVTSKGDIW